MNSYPPSQPPRPSGPKPPASPSPKPGPTPKPRGEAERLYTVIELAALWSCSRDHIYDLIAKRELTTVQVGIGRAKTRIPASAAAAFIARRTTKGRAA